MNDHRPGRPATGRKPWFGPKRVGWGLRPQTWQGWLVVALIFAAGVVIATLAHGR